MSTIYRPISEAPSQPATFWAWSGSLGALVLVQRTHAPEHRNSQNPDAPAVINWRHGKFWWPTHFVSLDDLPMPPGVKP